MKVLFLLIIFTTITSLKYTTHDYERIYALNIQGERQVVNKSEKTIIIMTNSIECSGCEAYLDNYMQEQKLPKSVKTIVITKYDKNTILRRQKYDYCRQKFQTSNDVLFFDNNTEVCNVKFKNFSYADFPVVLLIDNKKDYCKYYTFKNFAVELKGVLKSRSEFDSDFISFLK